MSLDPKTVFHLARGGEALGERTQEEILFSLRLGELKPDDLAWREGMSEWLPISSIPELSQTENIASSPAPAPAPAAPSEPVVSTSSPNPAAAAAAITGAASAGPLLSVSENQTDSISGAPPLASLGARFAGAFADGLIFFVAIMVPVLIIDGPGAIANEDSEPSDFAIMVAGSIFVILAITQLVLLSTRGQSLGKIMAKTRIHLHSTGEQAGFLNAVLLRGFVGNLPSGIPLLGNLYSLVNICFIFSSDRRCLHDLIGNTIVCKAE